MQQSDQLPVDDELIIYLVFLIIEFRIYTLY